MLIVENLYKEINNENLQIQILKGINFQVENGEFIGIMGASGSGKTTLLNILSLVDDATKGNININGTNVTALKGDKKANFRGDNIGFIFQDFNLLDNMTVEDNIALSLALKLESRKVIQKKVNELSGVLGISDQLKKYPYQLSGGQKQRVAIARALSTEPKIIFADEPTGALDSKTSKDLLAKLTELNKELNTTIFMVTHDADAASYCDRVLFIKDGVINSEMKRECDRKEFYEKISQNLSRVVGGDDI